VVKIGQLHNVFFHQKTGPVGIMFQRGHSTLYHYLLNC